MPRSSIFAACAFALLGCANGPAALPEASLAELHADPATFGELIYTGVVTPRGSDGALFHYERRVIQGPEETVASHLTFANASDEAVVLQRAAFAPGYALRRFTEIHGQTGAVSVLTVRADGGLDFQIRRGEASTSRSEGQGAPVVVGPTLFGFVLGHWDDLAAGRELVVRFAAADRARAYPFRLRRSSATPETITVSFEATDWFVRRAVAPMTMEFDAQTRRVLRYAGRVPPRLDGREFDAVVAYTMHAEEYR